MYHEIERQGRALAQAEPGYVRYVVREAEFHAQLDRLGILEFRGFSVSEGLSRDGSPQGVVITFDDGCETDLAVAAPDLKSRDFNATFYLVAGLLGQKGYLSTGQARELAEMGFEIGCHSMTHAYLTELAADELQAEIVKAKERLEQIIGRPVEHLSCPGGRWNQRVADLARESGYKSVSTSRIGANSPDSNPFHLKRVAILRETSAATFSRICRGQGLMPMSVAQSIRSAVQLVLGNSTYDRLRGALLRRS